jgi:tetratricopeptide (TPR) repeat protein
LNPNNASAHYFYAFTFLMPENRIDESLQEFRTALSLDPLSPIVTMNYALTLMVAHRSPEAVEQFQKLLQRDPSFGPAHFYLSQVYASMGRYADAVNEGPKGLRAKELKGSWTPDAQGFLNLMLNSSRPAPPTNIAVAYALAGDRDKAFAYLEKGYSEEDSELMACIRFPAFDSLHSDPRWASLMARLGLPQ